MKKTMLMIHVALAALFGAPVGYRTANAGGPAPAAEADNSTLGRLCKGAGVDPDDVRWRVSSGLDVNQAVDAALAQKESDAAKPEKKGGK